MFVAICRATFRIVARQNATAYLSRKRVSWRASVRGESDICHHQTSLVFRPPRGVEISEPCPASTSASTEHPIPSISLARFCDWMPHESAAQGKRLTHTRASCEHLAELTRGSSSSKKTGSAWDGAGSCSRGPKILTTTRMIQNGRCPPNRERSRFAHAQGRTANGQKNRQTPQRA